jgi:hypothetical protein
MGQENTLLQRSKILIKKFISGKFFAPEERYINRKTKTHDRTFTPEEQYINKLALISEMRNDIRKQLRHAPLERFAFL